MTDMHHVYTMMHARTTLDVDDALLERPAQLNGVTEETALVRVGLEALIAHGSTRRLARLAGSEPGLRPVAGRRGKRHS